MKNMNIGTIYIMILLLIILTEANCAISSTYKNHRDVIFSSVQLNNANAFTEPYT